MQIVNSARETDCVFSGRTKRIRLTKPQATTTYHQGRTKAHGIRYDMCFVLYCIVFEMIYYYMIR
jgi:hypothetical protein